MIYYIIDDYAKQIVIKHGQDERNTRIYFKSKKNCIVLGFYNYKTELKVSNTKTPEFDDFNFVPG